MELSDGQPCVSPGRMELNGPGGMDHQGFMAQQVGCMEMN